MLGRRELLSRIGRGLLGLPDPAAHGLIIRDLDTWIRLELLGVLARTGVADALKTPGTLDEIAARADIADRELLDALLELAVSLREVRIRRGRYSIRGHRLRAITGSSPDLRGVVEELVVYDNLVYSALESHLRGAPAAPYDANCGDVIAAASRVAEPILGPSLRALAQHVHPRTVLDIGCGSGVYLCHVLDEMGAASGLGVDLDNAAVAAASDLVRSAGIGSRCEVRHGDIHQLAPDLGQFDLVMLLNDIYYWEPHRRADALRAIRDLINPGGTIVIATATPKGPAFNRHLDIILRVTSSSHRLPTRDELATDLQTAVYADIEVTEPVPFSGFLIATARRP